MTVILSSFSTTFSEAPFLRIERREQTWPIYMDFEHVSGENFVAWVDSLNAPHGIFKNAFPAEFRLASDGTVAELGIRMEEAMREEKIWFKRI